MESYQAIDYFIYRCKCHYLTEKSSGCGTGMIVVVPRKEIGYE